MNLKDRTVLIVEDTYDDMQLVSTILTHSGIHVEIARSGEECLNLVHQTQPSIIITDLAMPIMDGWEMLKQLRSNPATDHIPVIAITAYYSVDVEQDAFDAGFNGYFAKPVSARHFVKDLQQLLG